jgi:hypothetical protein
MHAVIGGERGRKGAELLNVNEWMWTKILKARREGENGADAASTISFELFVGEPSKFKEQNKTSAHGVCQNSRGCRE